MEPIEIQHEVIRMATELTKARLGGEPEADRRQWCEEMAYWIVNVAGWKSNIQARSMTSLLENQLIDEMD